MQDFYNPIPAFVVYVRMYFTLIFQMYCLIPAKDTARMEAIMPISY